MRPATLPCTAALFLLLCFRSFPPVLSAQTIRVHLTEANKTPVIGATLRLLNRADTNAVLLNASDTAGLAIFKTKPGVQYQLEVQAMGFKPITKGVKATTGNINMPLTLEPDQKALNGVTITAKKPLLRQEDDKTIVDPEPIANSSTNAYEILEKTPGLFLDQDGNVYLSSTTPATIYINGREQRMSAADIAGILKSLPPNSIERLEILRTPSAKYDASGSGGIVNVVLKKGVKIGRTGSVFTGMNQGKLGNQFAGLTLNNSNGGRTSSLNFNYSRRNNYDQIITTRLLNADEILVQNAYTTTPSDAFYAGYSLGFEPDTAWEITVDGRASYNINRSDALNTGTVLRTFNPDDNFTTLNNLHNNGKSAYLNQGLRAKYKIDTLGSEWTMDATYNFSDYDGRQIFDIKYLNFGNSVIGGDGDIGNQRHFFTAQTDLKYKFPYQITFETGLKTSIQQFNSATEYFSSLDGNRIPDVFRTNAFRYKDAIHAGYIQASKTLKAWVIKGGVRAENTNMDGRQRIPSDTAFRIRRTDFFPYIYLSRPIVKIAGFPLKGYLIHRRSITRPAYEYLNPFPRFLDQYLYEAGNPALRPQFTNNFEFNISMQDYPILAVGRNHIQDIFTNVIYNNPQIPRVAYRTYDNLGKNEETYFRATAGMPPGGTFFFVAGAQYNHNRYTGVYENQPLTFTRGSWTFFTYQQLKLGQRSILSLHGFLRTKGQLQFYELSNFGNLNLNINRTFFDRKLTATLSVSDVFYTNRNDFVLNQGSIAAFGSRKGDTRRVGVNIRYNFGLKKKEEKGNNPFNLEGMEGRSSVL